ncbi:MAG: hypothetical protein ABIH67_00365 [Candidatus Uhrbacteria bacterium]
MDQSLGLPTTSQGAAMHILINILLVIICLLTLGTIIRLGYYIYFRLRHFEYGWKVVERQGWLTVRVGIVTTVFAAIYVGLELGFVF